MGQVDKIIRGLIAGLLLFFISTNVISGTAANFRRFAIIFSSLV
jgi:hypothetical protein